jgi:hypothetical protein
MLAATVKRRIGLCKTRAGYHFDVVVILECSVAGLAMVVVVDQVVRQGFLGRPSVITDTALEFEVVQGIHMVITRVLTVKPTRT